MKPMSKIILITGASSGVGEATARVLAANGHAVVLGARRTERLAQITAEIRAKGSIAKYRALDVADRDDVKAFVAFTHERFGRVENGIRFICPVCSSQEVNLTPFLRK